MVIEVSKNKLVWRNIKTLSLLEIGVYSVKLWIQLMKKQKIYWSHDHFVNRNCADICILNYKESWANILETDGRME